MKIKKITFSLTRKMPIPDIPFSNKEATFGMEIEPEYLDPDNPSEMEKIDKDKIWEEIKRQVSVGLDEDEQEWLKKRGDE